MNFLSRLLGGRSKPAQGDGHSRLATSGFQNRPPPSPQHLRSELLRTTLRSTLRLSGIPPDWITGAPLAASTRQGHRGIHWRLTITHWDSRLMVSIGALQERLMAELRRVDRSADGWLICVAWELACANSTAIPPMPHPSAWTRPARDPARASPRGGSADVISGPVRIEDAAQVAAAAAARLRRQREQPARGPAFAPTQDADIEATQPMHLNTRPVGLD